MTDTEAEYKHGYLPVYGVRRVEGKESGIGSIKVNGVMIYKHDYNSDAEYREAIAVQHRKGYEAVHE